MNVDLAKMWRRHYEKAHSYKIKRDLLRGKNKVNLLNVSNPREAVKNERIKGTVIAEYDYFYLVDNGNYTQTVLKNSLVNGDIKVIGCS